MRFPFRPHMREPSYFPYKLLTVCAIGLEPDHDAVLLEPRRRAGPRLTLAGHGCVCTCHLHLHARSHLARLRSATLRHPPRRGAHLGRRSRPSRRSAPGGGTARSLQSQCLLFLNKAFFSLSRRADMPPLPKDNKLQEQHTRCAPLQCHPSSRAKDFPQGTPHMRHW